MALADNAALQAVRDWCNARFVQPWAAGDSFAVYWHGAGFCTTSATQVLFSLPIDRPIKSGCTATLTYSGSSQGFILRSNGAYSHGSAATTYVKPSSTSCTVRDGYIDVTCTFSATTNAQNNAPIGITLVGTATIS